MRGIKGSARYKDEWEDKNLFPEISQWIQGVSTGKSDDVHFFRCKICKTGKLSLSNMGIGAVKKHMTDPSPRPSDPKPKKCKHNQILESIEASRQNCFTNLSSTETTNTNKETTVMPTDSLAGPSTSNNTSAMQVTLQTTIQTSSKEVARSEILWGLHAVYRYQSLRSTCYISNSKLFQAMFPDSSIAMDFSLSAAKLSYIVNHGLAPYFKNQIMQELVSKGPRLPPKFVFCFDESFNQTTIKTNGYSYHIF